MTHHFGVHHLTVYQYGTGSRGAALRAQRRLAEERRRENETRGHSENLKATFQQGCWVEFEEATDRHGLHARAKLHVAHELRRDAEMLEYRRNQLRELLVSEGAQWRREEAERSARVKELELDELRRAGAAIRNVSETKRRELAQEKRIQQYRERCVEARVMASERGQREASAAQKQQVAFRAETERNRQETERQWALEQRQRILQEQKEEIERTTRERLEQQRNTAETFRLQLQQKHEAASSLQANRLAEELKNAEMAKEHIRLHKEKEETEKREKLQKVKKDLLCQIEERQRVLSEQEKLRNEEARKAREEAARIAAEELENARRSVIASRREEAQSRLSVFEARRAREDYSMAFGRVVDAERRRLDEVTAREMEQRDEARRKLAKEVAEARAQQTASRERAALKARATREAEIAEMKALMEDVRMQEMEKRRADNLAREKYRQDLMEQIQHAKYMKEEQLREEERRRHEAVTAEEQFRRRALEQLTSPSCKLPHPFSVPPPPALPPA